MKFVQYYLFYLKYLWTKFMDFIDTSTDSWYKGPNKFFAGSLKFGSYHINLFAEDCSTWITSNSSSTKYKKESNNKDFTTMMQKITKYVLQ